MHILMAIRLVSSVLYLLHFHKRVIIMTMTKDDNDEMQWRWWRWRDDEDDDCHHYWLSLIVITKQLNDWPVLKIINSKITTAVHTKALKQQCDILKKDTNTCLFASHYNWKWTTEWPKLCENMTLCDCVTVDLRLLNFTDLYCWWCYRM